MDDDITTQNDEIEALSSIYDQDLIFLPSSSGKSFEIKMGQACFRVHLPADYPSNSEPKYEIFAPFLTKEDKNDVEFQMKDILNSSSGMPVVFALSECLKEFVEEKFNNGSISNDSTDPHHDDISVESDSCDSVVKDSNLPSIECPEILTGDCIEDRKSVFQGHFATVHSVDEVKAVIGKLNENRKIANATHNMYAYRITRSKGNTIHTRKIGKKGTKAHFYTL